MSTNPKTSRKHAFLRSSFLLGSLAYRDRRGEHGHRFEEREAQALREQKVWKQELDRKALERVGVSGSRGYPQNGGGGLEKKFGNPAFLGVPLSSCRALFGFVYKRRHRHPPSPKK